MDESYDLRPFTLQAVWDERRYRYSDFRHVFVELLDKENGEERVLNVKRYGWLMDYVSVDGGYIKSAQGVSEDVIGETLWGVVDAKDTLYFFGESPDSERLTTITRTGQNNP